MTSRTGPSAMTSSWTSPATRRGRTRRELVIGGRARDPLTANGFDLPLSTARLAPLSLRLEALYRAAADQPEIARHVFGVPGGSIPLTDLHTQTRLLPASLAA